MWIYESFLTLLSDNIEVSCSLWQDGPAYVRVFVHVLRDIHKDETVEYILALIDEMLTGNWIKSVSPFPFMHYNQLHDLLFIPFCSESEKGEAVS